MFTYYFCLMAIRYVLVTQKNCKLISNVWHNNNWGALKTSNFSLIEHKC